MNIRSISTNFQHFVDTILTDHIKFDVLGFTETRLNVDISSLYNLPNYQLYTSNRNTYGGGVAIYVSGKYHCTHNNACSLLDIHIESLGIEVILDEKTYLCICIYRPPQSNIIDLLSSLNEILNSTKDKHYQGVFMFGDFNIDLLQNNNSNVQEFINFMYRSSLFPLTTLPTRITTSSATPIDHVWISLVELNVANYVVKTDITDHFPIISVFKNINTFQSCPSYMTKRFYSRHNLEKFSSLLSEENWSDVF